MCYHEKEKEEEDEENTATLKCRGCLRYFVCGNGGVMISPDGSRARGKGLCWECIGRKRKKNNTKCNGWTQKMLDRLQEEEDMIDTLEQEKDNE